MLCLTNSLKYYFIRKSILFAFLYFILSFLIDFYISFYVVSLLYLTYLLLDYNTFNRSVCTTSEGLYVHQNIFFKQKYFNYTDVQTLILNDKNTYFYIKFIKIVLTTGECHVVWCDNLISRDSYDVDLSNYICFEDLYSYVKENIKSVDIILR